MTERVAIPIRVYRGRPDPVHQPRLTASNDVQAAAWSRDKRVRVFRRQLVYRGWPHLPPVEKGIDVALAVDLISWKPSGNAVPAERPGAAPPGQDSRQPDGR